MGLLRVLLAISVVLVHSKNNSFFFVDGQSAVEAFFVISGFYMALVLNEKYRTPDTNRLFWRNRFLRIYPLYWTVCGLTLLAGAGLFVASKGRTMLPFAEYLHDVATGHSVLNVPTVLSVLLSSVLIFGHEIELFFRLNTATGVLSYSPKLLPQNELTPLWHFMLIVPAWTLSLELMFYVLAPFLVRAGRGKWMIGAFMLSCGARFVLWRLGLNEHPWRYMFFPAELVFFLAGASLYFVKAWATSQAWFKSSVIPITLAVVALTLTFNVLHLPHNLTPPFYVACVTLSIPSLFAFSSRFRWDRSIGELSYPIYISHMLVMHCFEASFVPKALQSPWSTIAVTILIALALNKFVAAPIERKRQKPFARPLSNAVA